ncbi:hypothetical protein Tco_0417472, partial [Tanacetum coccineum]
LVTVAMKENSQRYVIPFLSDEENDKVNIMTIPQDEKSLAPLEDGCF